MLGLLGASRKRNLALRRSRPFPSSSGMTTRTEWQAQVGRNWAQMHVHTDRALTGLTRRLLERIAGLPGRTVLDIGCGAGELALAIAAARPDATVIGVDISPDLVAEARKRAREDARVEFVLADAAQWRDDDRSPDLLVSRHGVMFFDDPVAAFGHLRDIAASGANLVFSCFRTPGENPWASGVSALMPPEDGALPPAPHAPGPFAFADVVHVRTILSAAGWTGIGFEPVDFTFIAGAGSDPVSDAETFFARIGPAAIAMRKLTGEARDEFRARLRGWLEEHRRDDRVTFPGAAWIVGARRG